MQRNNSTTEEKKTNFFLDFKEHPEKLRDFHAKRISLLKTLLKSLSGDYKKFEKLLAVVESNKKNSFKIPEASRKNKKTVTQYLHNALYEQEQALAMMDKPGYQEFIGMMSDINDLADSGNNAEMLSALVEKNKLSLSSFMGIVKDVIKVEPITYHREITARKAVVDLQCQILSAMEIEGEAIEKLVRESLIENLKLTIKLREILAVTIMQICRDTFIKYKVHNIGLLRGIYSYEPMVKLVALLFHMPAQYMTTTFVLDHHYPEFIAFKASTPDIRATVSSVAELSQDDINSLTDIIAKTRAVVIDVAENSYAMTDELNEIIHEHALTGMQAWKQTIFRHLYSQLESAPRIQHDVHARVMMRLEMRFIEKFLADPDYQVDIEYDAYMNTIMSHISVADRHELNIIDGVGVFPFETAPHKDKNGRYAETPLGLFAACIDDNAAAVLALLRAKHLRNSSINQICDQQLRNAFIIVLQNKRMNLVEAFINNRYTDFDIIRNHSAFAYLLESPGVSALLKARARDDRRSALSPQYLSKLAPAIEPIATDSASDELAERDVKTYLSQLTPNVSLPVVIAAYENKILRNAQLKANATVVAAAHELLNTEKNLLAEAKKMKLDAAKALMKQHKQLLKKMTYHEKTIRALDAQLHDFQDESLSSSGSQSFFFNPVSAGDRSHRAIKDLLAGDCRDLQILLNTDFQSLFEDLALQTTKTLLSMQVNASLYTLMHFFESYQQLVFVADNDILFKNARLIQNALSHCKDLIDENVLAPGVKDAADDLLVLLATVGAFSRCVLECYLTKDYSALQQNSLYLQILGYGTVQPKEISDATRFYYTPRLTKMQLRYRHIELPETPEFQLLKQASMQMLDFKMHNYAFNPVSKKPKAISGADKHDEEKKSHIKKSY